MTEPTPPARVGIFAENTVPNWPEPRWEIVRARMKVARTGMVP